MGLLSETIKGIKDSYKLLSNGRLGEAAYTLAYSPIRGIGRFIEEQRETEFEGYLRRIGCGDFNKGLDRALEETNRMIKRRLESARFSSELLNETY